jgi:hypothetical protein
MHAYMILYEYSYMYHSRRCISLINITLFLLFKICIFFNCLSKSHVVTFQNHCFDNQEKEKKVDVIDILEEFSASFYVVCEFLWSLGFVVVLFYFFLVLSFFTMLSLDEVQQFRSICSTLSLLFV